LIPLENILTDDWIGWLCVLAWQGGTASACFLAGTQIQGLIILNNPNYVPQAWHGTMLAIGVICFCAFFNTFLAKRLPMVEGLVLILHVVGFFAVLIPLWIFAPRADPTEIFTTFSDGGNWGSVGLSCLVGILGPVVTLIGSDAATHMSEELQDASKTLPRAMISTIVVNGALGFIMLITFAFALGDVESVLATPTKYPYIQVFYNATRSKAGTTVMSSIIITLATFGGMMNVATASRQLFAFARDNGVPFSKFFSHVSFASELSCGAGSEIEANPL
jgi:choline transport protein